jgi:uncharacterized protein DUF1549/uncharacterized protein DUF1553
MVARSTATHGGSLVFVAAFAAVVLVPACDRPAPPRSATPILGSPAPSRDAPAPVALLTSADIDARLRAEWQRAGVAPTPPASDAVWLRRLWIDVGGTIPPPEVVRSFLSDRSAGKRARAIDDLLASPRWATHWTAYWNGVWMGRDPRGPDVDVGAFRGWLHDELARNAPWNEVVTELLTAIGRNSTGGAKREAEANEGGGGAPTGIHGAVNWTLKYQDNPQDLAGAASRTLLGVQLQCAQCHDHKTEKWTQKDFEAFAAVFTRTRIEAIDLGRPMGMVRRVEVSNLDRTAPRFAKKMADLEGISRAKPSALDGTNLGEGDDVRAQLASWLTAPGNPWFSRALVNRMWGHFLGRGFVDPVDDLRPSNPPVAPELFGALAADFAAGGYDVKRLVRVIVGTEAYASSAGPLDDASARADPEAKLWERFRVTPLGPDELLDAMIAATRLDAIVQETGKLDLTQVRFRVRQRYGFLFDVDEESDQSDYEGTLAQGLALLNGSVVATGASVLPGSALSQVLALSGDDATRIEELVLRTLSRFPTPAEVDRWSSFVQVRPPHPGEMQATPEASRVAMPRGPGSAERPVKGEKPHQPDPLQGLENRAGGLRLDARTLAYEDMLWTLLNSSEFVFNH